MSDIPKSSDAIEQEVLGSGAQSQMPAYPEAKLSDKQLEALYNVIGPAAVPQAATKQVAPRQVAPKQDVPVVQDEPDYLKDVLPVYEKKKEAALPEIDMRDRTIVKTVFLVIFLILLVAAGGVAGWYYWWTTHATFEYSLHPVVILEEQHVVPEDFMNPTPEMENVTAEFQNPEFDPFVGLQYIPLTLTLGLRTVDTSAALYVLTPIDSIEHEFAEEGTPLRAVDMLANAEVAANVPFDVHFTESPLPLEEYSVGEHLLNLVLNDVPFTVTLTVVDTTAPVALTVPVTVRIGESVEPEQFVTEVFDASDLKPVVFYTEPDVFLASDEEQDVVILIEDIHGNSTTLTSSLTLELNQTPPEIEGAPELIESKKGDAIDFLDGVFAHDDFGREMEVTVNDSAVDVDTTGTYIATLEAIDYTGNVSNVDITVHIINVDPVEFNDRLDTILRGITNDRMSQVDKAKAIHNWVLNNISKADTASRSDSVTEVAYQALENRRGNSFANSAVASVLLTRAGVENMLITRIESAATPHRWVLINPDDKGWHHFDAFRTGIVSHNSVSYMFTEKVAKEIAPRIKNNLNISDYYTYDTTLYPEIVKE